MPNLEFSVPFNGDAETLDATIALKGRTENRIREIYLNAPQAICGSGRVVAPTTEEDFVATVERIRAAGIRADITMNSTCDGAAWYDRATVEQQIGFIKAMHTDCGVEAVTLANPFLIEEARRACPDLEISASVLSSIDCFSRAEAFARAGATTMTVDTSINKNLKLLSQIVERLGVEIKLMVNEGCLDKCPYRMFHMNYISHKSKDSASEGTCFPFACGDITKGDPGQVFRSNWVRPEDLHRYEKITRFFKIVGRDMMPSKVLRCTRAYLEESWDGNLFDILCSSIGYYGIEYSAYVDNKALDQTSLFKRTSTCKRQCHVCTYCSDLAAELIGYGWITRENLEDLGRWDMIEAIEARFGGRYPACPRYAKVPGGAVAAGGAGRTDTQASTTRRFL
jgi:collagenase-like PrtC family protease